MTLTELTEMLQAHGIEEATWEALLLFSHFSGRTIPSLRADKAATLDAPALLAAAEKRCTHYPLQYILGTWEFMGLPFHVREGCLIPRSDTEILCEKAIELLKKGQNTHARVLDLCTGSGCILASVLHYVPYPTGTAVELSPDAAAIAEENFASLGLADRVTLVRGDIREDVLPQDDTYDLILSNPPYITVEEMNTLAPELANEPRMALTDEQNGLTLYHAILKHYLPHLKRDGWLLLEHGNRQAEAIQTLGQTHGLQAQTYQDYGGNPRCTMLWYR